MKRIVFLDYVRVFACFLVMVVHASENFYGAPGSTDMVGPQAFLANESDRLWVSIYDGFSRMAVPLFIIVSAFLLAPMKEGQTMSALYPHSTTVFHIHDTLQYSANVVGTD
jgi:surface polysaccharide O-acyltransferase-like enzyme